MTEVKFTPVWAFMGLVMLLFACSDEPQLVESAPDEIDPIIKANFAELAFDASDIQVETHYDEVSKQMKEYYVLEGDILISHEQMMDMLAQQQQPQTEQYRTFNLVTGLPRTIRVLGFQSGSSSATLDATMRSGLQLAVQNYNNLNLDLNFVLTFGSNTAGQDIVVRREIGSAGGRAGFPSGGNPFPSAFVRSGTTPLGLDVVEHVITHEIGHCLGLRHTDFFNRSISCGVGGNEGGGSIGAVQIPGTPGMTNIDLNSVMLACFSRDETGELSNFDRIALEELYGASGSPNPNPTISVSPTTIGIGGNGGSRTVTVTSNVNWTVSENSFWLSVSRTSGSNNGTFTINVGRHLPCEPQRFGQVTVNGGAAGSRTINISQSPRILGPNEQCP